MAQPGTLHRYTPRLVAFEHAPPRAASAPEPLNTLLWIGGLGDGLLTVRYPTAIAASLPPNWRLAEVLLSSSYKGWGTGSLKRDARELGDCVRYFKEEARKGGKVVLMGHSTGCQDIMEYLVGAGCEGRNAVEGVVLQGGVSDREAWANMQRDDEGMRKGLEDVMEMAEKMVKEGKEREVLPREGNVVTETLGAPVTAYRTHSLLAKGGDDDYFSSDLPDTTLAGTFGRIPETTPVMFLLGGEDPYVLASVDKEGLLKRFADAIRTGGGVVDDKNGGVLQGAHHNLNDDPAEVAQDLVKRVVGYLKGLESELDAPSRL
ncbi:DUF1749-domain-containing protein [Trematosphaeria pertusa]|uniref:DUF1749-domain-containing protein n=1 Tax=Trematosphaeria pertusa TaxID=390896 RepID=A0A6A6IL86_9PLEO|nr:DUF1749-domain-containing protein [Trematosphaeria pertusa]KAF2251191.1 DUF1749-domain-containing protein [Trematosphaeria pertusa]